MTTSCSSRDKLWRVFGCEFWVAPGGLLGTADACPELLPYQDPSARHSATLLTLSIRLSAPIFLSQSAAQSVSVSLPLSYSPHFPQYYHISTKAESKHCWLDGYIFISDRLGLVDGLCLERASLLTIPLRSYLGSGWRVRHIQYCVYGYWRQTGQWMFLNVFNPTADSIRAKTVYKNSQFIIGLLYLCQHCMVFRIHILL